MIKNVAAISTMFPIGFREEISVSTTILRPGALLITLRKTLEKKKRPFYGNSLEPFTLLPKMNLTNYGGVDIEPLCIHLSIYKPIAVRLIA